jgi:SAM-dependent methyltransferase
MRDIIMSPEKDPLGSMLFDYYNGDKNAFVSVDSTTLDMWKMTGAVMFRQFHQMNLIEKKALGLCTGKTLDVGAGAGCHSIYLDKRGFDVTSIDISPGCVTVMASRKIPNPIHANLFNLEGKRFDTLLLLMNGIGICGSLDGLNLFFQFATSILKPNGQILTDSTDLARLYPIDHLDIPDDQYHGETRFIMSYKKISGDPFDWLYIDFENT